MLVVNSINADGKEYYIHTSKYVRDSSWYIGLFDCTDEEPYGDITVWVDGIPKNCFALNHDLQMWCSKELLDKVLAYLTDDEEPITYVCSGYLMFPIYSIKEEVLNELNKLYC